MQSSRLASRLILGAVFSLATHAFAGPIQLGEWYQFSFTDPGVPAKGCDPADPTGDFCIPSSGTATTFLDTPPWTLTAPAQGAILRVTDSFQAGDRFELFDFGVSLGLTSAFDPSASCGDDPAVCIATPGISTGTFLLAAGDHSLTLVATESLGGGSGFLRADAVPEPGTSLLLAAGLASLVGVARRRKAVRQ